jgi:hypothetical protein
MSLLNRRQSFKLLLGGLLQTAGTVVLASSVLPGRAATGEDSKTTDDSAKNIEERANQVADANAPRPEGEGEEFASFINGAFRNAGGGVGGFRNAAGGGGAFRNGGFANGGGGGAFKNGGFANGGGGAGFKNGGFANGGGGSGSFGKATFPNF